MATNTATSNNAQSEASSPDLEQMEQEYQMLVKTTLNKRSLLVGNKKRITNHRELMYLSIHNAMHRLRVPGDDTTTQKKLRRGSFDRESVPHSYVFVKGTPPCAIAHEFTPRTRPAQESKWPSSKRIAPFVSTMAADIPRVHRGVLHMLGHDIASICDKSNYLRGYSRPIAALACLILVCRALDLTPSLVLGSETKYFGLHPNAAISASNVLWHKRKKFARVIRKHDGEMDSLENAPTRTEEFDRPYATVEGEIIKAFQREQKAKKKAEKRARVYKPSPLRTLQSVSELEENSLKLPGKSQRLVKGDETPQVAFDRLQKWIDAKGPRR